MQTQTLENIRQKFRDAEHLWFWFLSSRKIRTGFYRQTDLGNRPCELVDIEAVITRLFLAGKLSQEMLAVMKCWGERRRAPNRNIYAQSRDADLWGAAMGTLGPEFRARGWIE
ncbi:MAG: hypothetical protein FWC61_02915 [Proteobacteria bacterium]|nr:hypothetical protein [Pseudomonadota bacterium]